MRIVVTGGTGFIGSHLTEALKDRGYSVVVYDSKMRFHEADRIRRLQGAELVEADILDMARLKQACRGAESIYHLAAQVSVPHSMERPSVDFDSNLRGTVNILEVSRRIGARLLFASSAAVYGLPETNPIPETHDLKPISFYGLSKTAAELYCAMYSNVFNLPVTIFRIFNCYGPCCHGVVYDVLSKLSRNLDHLPMLGRPDGSKDFIYVSDVIDAMTASLETEQTESLEVFNIGSGASTSIADLTFHICSIMGVKPQITFSGSSWIGDITEGSADISKIFTRFRWRPKVGLREGLVNTIDWFCKAHPDKPELKLKV
jgi:UDP-glucose 4-epimerase